MAATRARYSAGILLYRHPPARGPAQPVEVLLGHMGGPYWSRKQAGAWTIPKGEHDADEDPLTAALREFEEELGIAVPVSDFLPLGSVRQSGGKIVTVWAGEGDLDATATVSGTFMLEWPPRSGVLQEYPELDHAAWVALDEARELLVRAQTAFLDRLVAVLAAS